MKKVVSTLLCMLFLLALSTPLKADPCGMVPPIVVDNGQGQQLTRVGQQMTFAYFKDGIQDIVLAPSFKGRVDEFGMLIPFPSLPAIRKAPDDIFAQIDKAVNPQIINIDLRWRTHKHLEESKDDSSVINPQSSLRFSVKKKESKNKVTVLKQEAVGMYQVAVLEAGSTEVLKKWMAKHKYQYPKGMDDAVNHYVKEKWVFVAIKAKVGNKKGASPKPGMRDTKKKTLPKDSEFTGSVQAMGFRFKVTSPIIPMRLSSYNPGTLNNTVYFLSDGPMKISQLDKVMVKKQLSGAQLFKHLTQKLPARYWLPHNENKVTFVKCGEEVKIDDKTRKHYDDDEDVRRRDPSYFNGKAKDLIFSDLLASHKNMLEHDFEKKATELLNISEELGLRGKDVDNLLSEIHKELRDKSYKAIMNDLKKMTLTVFEGEFPRMTLRNNDLTFVSYEVPITKPHTKNGNHSFFRLSNLISTLIFILILLSYRRTRKGAVLILTCGSFLSLSPISTVIAEENEGPSASTLKTLENPKKGSAFVDALINGGKKAVPALVKYVSDKNNSVTGRGRALICLKKIQDKRASDALAKIYNNKEEKHLIRLWVAASWVHIDSEKALDTVFNNPHQQTMMQISSWISRMKSSEQKRQNLQNYFGENFDLIEYDMFNALNHMIMKNGSSLSKAFAHVCLKGSNNNARRSAASFLASPKVQSKEALKVYIETLSYTTKKAQTTVPWKGGALFVPGIRWNQENSQELSSHLIQWMMWAEMKKQSNEINQIRNNLASLGNQVGIATWRDVWNMKAYQWVIKWVDRYALPGGKITTNKNTLSQAVGLLSTSIALTKNDAHQKAFLNKLKNLHGIK